MDVYERIKGLRHMSHALPQGRLQDRDRGHLKQASTASLSARLADVRFPSLTVPPNNALQLVLMMLLTGGRPIASVVVLQTMSYHLMPRIRR